MNKKKSDQETAAMLSRLIDEKLNEPVKSLRSMADQVDKLMKSYGSRPGEAYEQLETQVRYTEHILVNQLDNCGPRRAISLLEDLKYLLDKFRREQFSEPEVQMQ